MGKHHKGLKEKVGGRVDELSCRYSSAPRMSPDTRKQTGLMSYRLRLLEGHAYQEDTATRLMPETSIRSRNMTVTNVAPARPTPATARTT